MTFRVLWALRTIPFCESTCILYRPTTLRSINLFSGLYPPKKAWQTGCLTSSNLRYSKVFSRFRGDSVLQCPAIVFQNSHWDEAQHTNVSMWIPVSILEESLDWCCLACCVCTPVAGSTKLIEWFTVWWFKPRVPCIRLYADHWSVKLHFPLNNWQKSSSISSSYKL